MAERPLIDESNPQGIASDDEKTAAYRAGLENELVNAKASLKSAERYGEDAKVRVETGHILDIEEELAKLGGASEDEAAEPKKNAKKDAKANAGEGDDA